MTQQEEIIEALTRELQITNNRAKGAADAIERESERLAEFGRLLKRHMAQVEKHGAELRADFDALRRDVLAALNARTADEREHRKAWLDGAKSAMAIFKKGGVV